MMERLVYLAILIAVLFPVLRWLRRVDLRDQRRRSLLSEVARKAEDEQRWWERHY
jgi:hypothetical protein